jgi:hypothetical protein
MIRDTRGAAFILGLLVLAGCAGPIRQREAESLAGRSLRRFCQDKSCGALHMVKTQKLKNRWMVDYETPGGLYTVAVDESGATDVTVWNK